MLRLFLLAAPIVTVWTIASLSIAGDLDPPAGAIAPTMKSLNEVEPRIPINFLPGNAAGTHVIALPGSYYLTSNIHGEAGKSGLVVSANDVTIDLAGFALIGVPGSEHGIENTGGDRNITVVNGVIREWDGDGVRLTSYSNSVLRDLHAYSNGGIGLRLGSGAVITRCVAESNGDTGIIAGTGSIISECTARKNIGNGISPGGRSITTACTADANSGIGFTPGSASTISNCNAGSNAAGIRVISDCMVRGNICDQNDGPGIETTGNENLIESNTVTRCFTGLKIGGLDNTITGNVVRSCGDNYDFSASTQVNILLCDLPETLDWPCDVTLVGSLRGVSGMHGLTVTSDDVSVDLAGHSLIGVSGSLSGINVQAGVSGFSVRNGAIRGWDAHGIDAMMAIRPIASGIIASGNGDNGIRFGDNATVSHCIADSNNSIGIFTGRSASISESKATSNATTGISADQRSTISDCIANDNQTGIAVNAGCTIRNCLAADNSGVGISSFGASMITGCNVVSNDGDGIFATSGLITGCDVAENGRHGIYVFSDARIISNRCDGNTTTGIRAEINRNVIEGNQVLGSTFGIDVDGTYNLIVRNALTGNSTDLDIGVNNAFGPFASVFWIGDISAQPAADHPAANLSY